MLREREREKEKERERDRERGKGEEGGRERREREGGELVTTTHGEQYLYFMDLSCKAIRINCKSN